MHEKMKTKSQISIETLIKIILFIVILAGLIFGVKKILNLLGILK